MRFALALGLCLLAASCASAARELKQGSDTDYTFGEEWIKQFGYTPKHFRFYLAQEASKVWTASSPLELANKRANFKADMTTALAAYLAIYPVRITFPIDLQPQRSWLRTPTNQRDIRSFIDVNIEFPNDSPFNPYPKDILNSAAWVLGAGDATSFAATWNVGVTVCDTLDPDYAFTNPFTGTCLTVANTDCQNQFPICQRVVEEVNLPPPTPDITGSVSVPVTLSSIYSNRRSLKNAGLDGFFVAYSVGVAEMLQAKFPELGNITVTVVDVKQDANDNSTVIVAFYAFVQYKIPSVIHECNNWILFCDLFYLEGILPQSFFIAYHIPHKEESSLEELSTETPTEELILNAECPNPANTTCQCTGSCRCLWTGHPAYNYLYQALPQRCDSNHCCDYRTGLCELKNSTTHCTPFQI